MKNNFKTIYFVTTNKYKFNELKNILKLRKTPIDLIQYDYAISELQSFETQEVISDKIKMAYRKINQNILVDHTALSLDALDGLPKGWSKEFWAKFVNHVCEVTTKLNNKNAIMTIAYGYCDGRKIIYEPYYEKGIISKEPSKKGTFNLDRIFIPEYSAKPLSEMDPGDRAIHSPRRHATDKFLNILHDLGHI